MKRLLAGSSLFFGLLGLGCSDDASGPGVVGPATGAAPGSGGATVTGGAAATGGTGTGNAPGVGGTAAGGAPAVGGTSTGGAPTPATGGTPAVGGTPGTGGAPATGGVATGGAAAGGAGTGGDAAGGTPGTGGSPAVDEPSLVTSAEGAYWQTGEVTAGAAGPATLTVNTAGGGVNWAGFGGTFNQKGWTALLALNETDRNAVMQLLFDANAGIGFDWGRIPMGPSDYANQRYTLSSAPGQFDITPDVDTLIPFIKAAQTWKSDVKYWGSPWTPPPWAKTGDTENMGYDKGIFDPAFNQDYANFFVAWVDAYEQQGIPIDHVQPQNEPGWSQGYPTCAFGPARDSTLSQDLYQSEPVSLGPFVMDYLKPALDATSYGTKIWYGTLSNDSFFNDYWNSLTDKSVVEGIALQWETKLRVPGLRAGDANMLIMQSEHKCGNYPWLGAQATSRQDANRDNFLSTMAPNNHAYGEESWDLIKGWIDDGVSIYSAWNMVLDTGGFNLDESRPWPQNSMIAVDTSAGTYEVTAYYYVFRHVAQYVDEGAKVLSIGGNALAFQNPDGAVVAVVFNEGNSAASHTIDIDGTLLEFSVPARGWATVNWQG